MRSRTLVLFALLFEFGSGCKTKVRYYCDKDTPCLPRYPDRPYCDLTGEYEPEGIRNTCVADPYDGGTVSGPDGGSDADGGLFDAQPPSDGNDQPDPIVEDIAHVAAAHERAGTADITITGTVLIDTTDLTYDGGTPPAGAQLDASGQDGGNGVDLAILHVRSLSVAPDATLRAVGSRALVIIASGTVSLDGVIDASATGEIPGAGGAGPGAGAGAGQDGETASFATPGGGGGSFAHGGASGGSAMLGGKGGFGGSVYGDSSQTTLFGGSGGGSSTDCAPNPPGAGGGAVQIYAGTSISIQAGGGINVGGGGAGGGKVCSNLYGGGGGGGSGGAIFLQAPSVMSAGTMAANGGGGGSGANTVSNDGHAGADGGLAASQAVGGDTPAYFGTAGAGGGGAFGVESAQPGADTYYNGGDSCGGGGGGGSVGRITVLVHSFSNYENTGVTTPAETKLAY